MCDVAVHRAAQQSLHGVENLGVLQHEEAAPSGPSTAAMTGFFNLALLFKECSQVAVSSQKSDVKF